MSIESMSIREKFFLIRFIIKSQLNHWALAGEHSNNTFRKNVARGWYHQDEKYKTKDRERDA